MTFLKSTCAALALIAIATPALADPLKDTVHSMEKVWVCGQPKLSQRECLAAFIAQQAANQSYQEAALTMCPDLVVVDPKLRALRNKKYRNHPAFINTYQMLTTYTVGASGLEIRCLTALGPDAYGTAWLGKR